MTREQFKKYIRKVEEVSEFSGKLSDLGVEILNCKELFYVDEIFSAWVKSDFGEEGEDLVSWWLYEDVDKILYKEDGGEISLEDIDDLYTFLEKNYTK